MMSFSLRAMRIRTRLLVCLGIVAASLAFLAASDLTSTRSAQQRIGALLESSNAASASVAQLREAIGSARRFEAGIYALGASNTLETGRLAGLWKAQLAAARQAGDQLAARAAGDDRVVQLVATLRQQLDAYAAGVAPIIQQLQGAQIDGPAALAYAQLVEDKAVALGKSSDAILVAGQEAQGRLSAQIAGSAERAALMRLALIAATLAVVAPLLWFTMRSISRPIERAVRMARRIAEGDLSEALDIRGTDETAQLLIALQSMQTALRALVAQVRDSADSIRVASSEVASGNLDLSQRTEQAAANVQVAASSIELLHGVVSQSEQSARTAKDLAGSASAVARRGGEAVARVVDTMQQINAHSRKIGDIIATIDGIAFQTNILALNAAVEAARAGEEGRGFAVVASEVRGLAQRSASAAKEIRALIVSSVESAEAGARLVQDAGATMDEIVGSVERVTTMVGEISQAASGQSHDIGNVNESVAELDRMTQQNAALVEESFAAAHSLSQQATTLAELVARFQLERGVAPAA